MLAIHWRPFAGGLLNRLFKDFSVLVAVGPPVRNFAQGLASGRGRLGHMRLGPSLGVHEV